MNAPPWLVLGIVLAFVAFFVFKYWVRGGAFPPHEFAYGAALPSADEIPEMIDQFFSIEGLDPEKFQIKTYVGNQSEKNLKPLIRYISSQKNPDFKPLIAELRETDKLTDQRQKAVRLVKVLVPYKDKIRDESERDFVIVFASYGLKDPSHLPQALKGKIGNLVQQADTGKQSAAFNSAKCPRNYLAGNVNIYPLDVENTFWHDTADFGSSKQAPILEIRFMGLTGIFRYLMDEMAAKTRLPFVHLDGTSMEPVGQATD